MPFLNTDTGEYPRYAGDVVLSPNAAWVAVEETPRPEAGERQVVSEGEPVKGADGVYRQTWIVTSFTETEWFERRRGALEAWVTQSGLSVDELRTLLAEGK